MKPSPAPTLSHVNSASLCVSRTFKPSAGVWRGSSNRGAQVLARREEAAGVCGWEPRVITKTTGDAKHSRWAALEVICGVYVFVFVFSCLSVSLFLFTQVVVAGRSRTRKMNGGGNDGKNDVSLVRKKNHVSSLSCFLLILTGLCWRVYPASFQERGLLLYYP